MASGVGEVDAAEDDGYRSPTKSRQSVLGNMSVELITWSDDIV